MEDFPSQHVQALSAHILGLEAALEALSTDASAVPSIRRIARSLSSEAAARGASELARAARRVQAADDASIEAAARNFLDRIESLRQGSRPRQIRLLLVEDNRTIAAAMQAYLIGPEYVVRHAATAGEAEALLAGEPIDLVLLDLILPDRDGRDLLVQMREDRTTASIPVIVLSAKEGAVARAECLAVGACEFIEKPVTPATLRAAVARHARPPLEAPAEEPQAVEEVMTRAGLVEAYEPLRLDAERGTPAAVVLIAVNDFELVSDALGGEASDSLVVEVIGQLSGVLADGELIGRWGRSQIVMLMPQSTSVDAKGKLKSGMARLAASDVIERFATEGVPITFSAGAVVAEAGQDLRDVVSAAEQSLLRARRAGRGVVVTPEELEAERPPRVLLLEDDRVTATLVHHRLVREGFEVMDFVNGEEAFEWAVDHDFELGILDVKVPGMDGFELLERLRKIRRLDSVPIVMLTGLGGEDDVVRGLGLGANDYMLKPFSPTELLARIRRLVYVDAPGSVDPAGTRRGNQNGVAAH